MIRSPASEFVGIGFVPAVARSTMDWITSAGSYLLDKPLTQVVNAAAHPIRVNDFRKALILM
jgi:hypothetical protein